MVGPVFIIGKDGPAHCLHCIAEADELLYMMELEKGAWHLTCRARHHGAHARTRGISNEQVCIQIAHDRTGQTLGFVTGKGALTKAQLHTCLLPFIDSDVLLVTDGYAAYRTFSREADISHLSVNWRAGTRVQGAVQVTNVNSYQSRLRDRLRPFHGVDTRYLPNYLGRRRILDAGRTRSPEPLLRATLGAFPNWTLA